jgi:hypothetical protein
LHLIYAPYKRGREYNMIDNNNNDYLLWASCSASRDEWATPVAKARVLRSEGVGPSRFVWTTPLKSQQKLIKDYVATSSAPYFYRDYAVCNIYNSNM